MLRASIQDAHEISEGVWSFHLPPHQVRMFGKCDCANGVRSVLLLAAAEFDRATSGLAFHFEDATTLNIGSSTETIAILSCHNDKQFPMIGASNLNSTSLSRGDNEFLEMCKAELPDHMQKVAHQLLTTIRARSPGELKRGKARNFSDTPDNFWYVIVQPRVEQLSITVRGPVDLFDGVTHLPVKDDRGNTLFKISDQRDVNAAVELIFRAKRKL